MLLAMLVASPEVVFCSPSRSPDKNDYQARLVRPVDQVSGDGFGDMVGGPSLSVWRALKEGR